MDKGKIKIEGTFEEINQKDPSVFGKILLGQHMVDSDEDLNENEVQRELTQ